MKLFIESTVELTYVDGVQCRVWQGRTGKGAKVIAFIAMLGAQEGTDLKEFEAELEEQDVILDPSSNGPALPN